MKEATRVSSLGLTATALFLMRTSSGPGVCNGASLTTKSPPASRSQTAELDADMVGKGFILGGFERISAWVDRVDWDGVSKECTLLLRAGLYLYPSFAFEMCHRPVGVNGTAKVTLRPNPYAS